MVVTDPLNQCGKINRTVTVTVESGQKLLVSGRCFDVGLLGSEVSLSIEQSCQSL